MLLFLFGIVYFLVYLTFLSQVLFLDLYHRTISLDIPIILHEKQVLPILIYGIK